MKKSSFRSLTNMFAVLVILGEVGDSQNEEQDFYYNGRGDFDGEMTLFMKFTNKYCNERCDNGAVHTLCQYQSATDKYDHVTEIMGAHMRKTILREHNVVRNNYANGHWTKKEFSKNQIMSENTTFTENSILGSTYLPLAGNMREMQWNEELAKSARMWASQCKGTSDLCRDAYLTEGSNERTYVSQLIDAVNWTGGPDGIPAATWSFSNWYQTYPHFTADIIAPYKRPTNPLKDYSSFAQIIWADSYLLGCSSAMCRNLSSNNSLIVTACNYGPGGLLEGNHVYFKGGPCTRCRILNRTSKGGSYCSREFPNLCSGTESASTQFTALALLSILGLENILQ